MTRCLCTLTAAVLLIGAAVRGENWPEFRGPTGQGIVRQGELPVEWSRIRNVVWKRPIRGKGWSSPVVHTGRVYLTTAVTVGDGPSHDQSLRAMCLDAETGKVVWDREVFHQNGATAGPINGKNSHASPTPVVRGRRLYVHFGHHGTACLDLSGKVLWRNTSLKYNPVHGNGGSPILAGDALVFSCDGGDKRFVTALDCDSGNVLWKTDRTGEAHKKFSFSTPLLITVHGQKQLISPGSNVVVAYDPDTGREIWRVRYDGYSVVPRPVYGHGLVFVCTGYEESSLLAVRPDGAGDVTDTHVVWRTGKAAPHTSSPLVVGDELYMVSDAGVASCLDAATGRVHWQRRIGGAYSASPVFAADRVYVQSEQGTGVVLKAGKQFKVLARNPLGERTLASYAAAEGALFIRTEENLFRIQAH